MKILFLTHHYLNEPGGGVYASSAYINTFADLADELVLLYPYSETEPKFISTKVKKIPVKNDKTKVMKYFDLLRGRVHRYYDIAPQLKEKYDLVVFDTSVVSFRLVEFFKQRGIKTLCIHHNYQIEYFKDNCLNILTKIPTLFWCKRYEGQAIRECDLNLVLTDSDRQSLVNFYHGNPKKIFKIGVFEYSPHQYKDKFDKSKKECPLTFVITGDLSSKQTEDSIIPWLRDYYPILEELLPDSKLIIAGRNPSSKIYDCCALYKKVKIIPNPESMYDVLSMGDIYICPTSLGGGLKLRIMDGLRSGMTVISHAVSTRGYEDFMEKSYLLSYDNPETFRTAIKNVIESSCNRENIIDFYNSVFSYSAGLERVKYILKKLDF